MKYHDDKETASRYLSDLLSAEERAEYERHLAECDECAREVQRYRRMGALLRNLPQVKAPVGLHDAVMENISAEKPAERRVTILRSWRLRAVAALLVLAAGVGGIFALHKPTPQINHTGVTAGRDTGETIAGRPAPHAGFANAPRAMDGTLRRENPVTAYADDATKLALDKIAAAGADSPGAYDPATVADALNRINSALAALTLDQLKALAAPDHGRFVGYVYQTSMPDLGKAGLRTPADNALFLQMARKRVLQNALEKAGSMTDANSIVQVYNAQSGDLLMLKAASAPSAAGLPDADLNNKATRSKTTALRMRRQAEAQPPAAAPPAPEAAVPEENQPAEDGRAAPAPGEAMPETKALGEAAPERAVPAPETETLGGAAPQPDDTTGGMRAPAVARAPSTTSEAAKASEVEAADMAAKAKEQKDKAMPTLESQGRDFHAEGNAQSFETQQNNTSGEKGATLKFRQSILIYAVTPSGEKRALTEAERDEVQAVFNSLPTLENYHLAGSAKAGLNARLSEGEFLRLLKDLNGMATVKAAVGPLQAELVPAEKAPADKGTSGEIKDPYAVDVQIIFE